MLALSKQRFKGVFLLQLLITERNVQAVPTHDLLSRFKKIERQIKNRQHCFHPDIFTELLNQKELIEKTLIDRGAGNLLSKQLILKGLEPPVRAQYKKLVIIKLKEYFKSIKLLKEKEKKLAEGFDLIFPSGTSSYNDEPRGYSESISSTEKAILKNEERTEALIEEIQELKRAIKPVERAIKQLDPLEKKFILRKYSDPNVTLDVFIIQELHVDKTTFYDKIAGPAYLKIAESLKLL